MSSSPERRTSSAHWMNFLKTLEIPASGPRFLLRLCSTSFSVKPARMFARPGHVSAEGHIQMLEVLCSVLHQSADR